jgi:hypothetical protein
MEIHLRQPAEEHKGKLKKAIGCLPRGGVMQSLTHAGKFLTMVYKFNGEVLRTQIRINK